MKRILCYGDSNSWGFIPDSFGTDMSTYKRFSKEIRWPGRLQKLLGDSYEIIEECLCGRTTNMDDPDFIDRNGLSYLRPCLESQAPLDIVILFLGGNDLKARFNRSAYDIAQALKQMVQVIQNLITGAQHKSPEILLIAQAPLVSETYFGEEEFVGAIAKSKKLAAEVEKVAQETECHFLDSANFVTLSEIDGVHHTEEDHLNLAKAIADLPLFNS
jgi:lysophospholipase L1-like esterase